MVLLRTYDERSVVYQRQGRIGTYAIFWSHEAIQAGAHARSSVHDWVFPSYRESAIGLLRGMPPDDGARSWWGGHPAGWWNPATSNVGGICVPIAKHDTARGRAAWGKKLRARAVCIVILRRRRDSEGAFHEGANFAAVMQAPVVLLCNNNQWAISTPLWAQTHAEALADKAVGYGMPGVQRGWRRRARGLRGHARGGRAARVPARGRHFVEAVRYRAAPHATADDPRATSISSAPSRRRARVPRPLRAATSAVGDSSTRRWRDGTQAEAAE